MNEYRHEDGGVISIYPQPTGSRLVFEDERGNVCLFNPVNDQVRLLTSSSQHITANVASHYLCTVQERFTTAHSGQIAEFQACCTPSSLGVRRLYAATPVTPVWRLYAATHVTPVTAWPNTHIARLLCSWQLPCFAGS